MDLLDRQGLLSIVERCQPRLMLIVAPAGYGKTTVAQTIAQRRERSAYCDALGVSSAADLAARLMTAFSLQEPERSVEFATLTIGGGRDPAMMIETAKSAWRQPATSESLLVVDHLDRAVERSDVRSFVDSLVDRPNSRRSLILCSRDFPNVLTTRFAAPHETLIIGRDELRLTVEEIHRVIPTASKTQVEEIAELTTGWPIAVFYVAQTALRMRLEDVLRDIRNRRVRPIEDYFAQEVLSQLSATQREAVRICAVIDDMSLADAVLALRLSASEAQRLLDELPFVNFNGESQTYQMHPLFRTSILQRDSKVSAALTRVIDAHRAANNDIRAAQLLVRIGDIPSAAAALESVETFLFGAPTLEAARVMASIDVKTLVAHPGLWNASTLARVYGISLFQWLDESRTVWRNLSETALVMVRAGVVSSYANACGVLGLFEEGRSALKEFSESLRDEELSAAAPVLHLWEGAYLVWEGLPVDIEGVTRDIAPMLESPATTALWMYNAVARYHRTMGNCKAERAALFHALDAASRSRLPFVIALVAADLVIHYWFWGDDVSLPTRFEG